ncbi:MAG: C25 family cysteine peptidase [Candidatus Hodarchaeota archaeon]
MVGIIRRAILLVLLILCLSTSIPQSSFWLTSITSQPSQESNKPPSFPSLPQSTNLPSSKGLRHPSGSTWIPFTSNTTEGIPPEYFLISQDEYKIEIGAIFYGMWNWTEQFSGINYNVLEIPFTGTLRMLYFPELPVVTRLVEIPHGVDVDVFLLQGRSSLTQLPGTYYVKPYPGPGYTNTTTPDPIANGTAYYTNAMFPAWNVSAAGTMANNPIIFRRHRLLPVNFIPVQYNNATGRLQAFSRMVIRIKFDSRATMPTVDPKFETRAYSDLFRRLILNYRAPSLAGTSILAKGPSTPQIGYDAEYLIITIEEFREEVEPLRVWKQHKGFRTDVVTVQDILEWKGLTGPYDDEDVNRTAITEYIKGMFWAGDKALEYVLLVGDANHIPPHYESEHTFIDHRNTLIGTDLFYFTVDGPDFLPDIYYGRLSANTSDDVTAMVNKIVAYETQPPQDEQFYRTAKFYDLYRLDSEGKNLVNNLNELYFNEIPSTHYYWPTDAFETGHFLAFYLGHGSSLNFRGRDKVRFLQGEFEGWQHPQYWTQDAAKIKQYSDNKYPVLLSLACDTGWYDGETDRDSTSTQYDIILSDHDYDCFCENITRMAGSGAVAAIGSSRHATFNYMGQMTLGIFDGLYPGLDPTLAEGHIPSLGQLLIYGKMYLIQIDDYGYHDPYPDWNSPSAYQTNQTFQMLQLFGDPEMTISTQALGTLDVQHPKYMGSEGLQSFVVTVTDEEGEPVADAKVCLTLGNNFLVRGYTLRSGYAFFDITPPTWGSMRITVSKQNYTPYQGDIKVTPEGAVIWVDPSSGKPDEWVNLHGSGFNPNKLLYLKFGDSVYDPEFQPFTEPDEAEPENGVIREHNIPVPDAAVIEEVQKPLNIVVREPDGPAAVTLFNREAFAGVDVYLYSQQAALMDYHQIGGEQPQWNNPDIWIIRHESDFFGRSYMIYAEYHNRGPESAYGVSVEFAWSPLGMGQNENDWWPIDTALFDDSILVEDSGFATSVPFSPHTPYISVMVVVNHIDDIDETNNVGVENFHTITAPSSDAYEEVFEIANYFASFQAGIESNPHQDETSNPHVSVRVAGPYPSTSDTAVITASIGASFGFEEEYRWVITAWSDSELIDGIEILLTKGLAPEPNWILIIIIAVIVLFVIILVIYALVEHRRKRKSAQNSDSTTTTTPTNTNR